MRQKRLQGSHFANDAQARGLTDLVAAKRVDPCLSRVFPWEELGEAHQLMHENKHPHGNMAVLVGARETGTREAPALAAEPEVVYGRPRPFEDAEAARGSEDRLRVRDLMTAGVVTCGTDATVLDIAKLLVEHAIHAVVVCDVAGEAVGVASQTNLVLARQGRSRAELGAIRAVDIMNPELVACEPETPVSEAVTAMTRARIHRLVVLEGGGRRRPIGVISMTDVVRTMIEKR
jgi:crotonyl-CoA carboxylase/reductase